LKVGVLNDNFPVSIIVKRRRIGN